MLQQSMAQHDQAQNPSLSLVPLINQRSASLGE